MNSFQDLFERQKRHFASGATRDYAWRIEQLDRMARLVGENEAARANRVACRSSSTCISPARWTPRMGISPVNW